MTQIAAQLFTLKAFTQTPADIAATLKKVRQIGYEAVQISGFGPCDPAEVARMLKDNCLACCSTHTAWPRFLNEIDQVIAEHRLWGCVHPALGMIPKDMRTEQGLLEFIPLANQVGEKLAAAGMDFSYHNHDLEFQKIGGKTWLETLYERTNPAWVKPEIDTYWVQSGGGDPAEWVRRYAGRMPILHVKDMIMGPEGRRFAPIGAGNMNFPAILAAARAAGVQWYCVEQDKSYEADPFDCLKLSLENLRKMGLK